MLARIAAEHPTTRHVRHSSLLRWFLHLGGLGLFVLAIVDSSLIPVFIPGSADLVLLLLISHRSNPFYTAGCAVAGSIIGGYLSWSAGKKGGEIVLNKYVPHRLLQPLSRWVTHHGGLSVFAAALVPPPIPLLPFLVTAGSLGVPRQRFLVAFGSGRIIRYGLLAWLANSYGRRIVRVWTHYLSGWSRILLWAYIALLVAGVAYGIWKYKRQRIAVSP